MISIGFLIVNFSEVVNGVVFSWFRIASWII